MPASTEKRAVQNTLSGIAALYSDGLRTHGRSPKSLGWKDTAGQSLRFSKLRQVLLPQDAKAGIRVIDWGCGYGAMFGYLKRHGVRVLAYDGYDISRSMIDEARQTIDDPRATFIHSDRVKRAADYAFVSGTFNVRLRANRAVWTRHIERTLMALAAKCTKGLAFNLLTTHVDWKVPHLYYGDPSYFFTFCKRHIARNIVLLHDYPLYEWTLLIRKDA